MSFFQLNQRNDWSLFPLLHPLLLRRRLSKERPAGGLPLPLLRLLHLLLCRLLLLLPFKELRDGPPEVLHLGAAQTRLQSRRAAREGLAPAPARSAHKCSA